MQRLTVNERLVMVVLIPFLALAILITLSVQGRYAELGRLSVFKPTIETAKISSALVHELQKERGASAGLLSAKGEGPFKATVKAQRDLTNQAFAAWTSAIDARSSVTGTRLAERTEAAKVLLAKLRDFRDSIDNNQVSVAQSFSFFSTLIDSLIGFVGDMILDLEQGSLITELQGYRALMIAKERAGMERATGTALVNAATPGAPLDFDRHRLFTSIIAQQEAYFNEFKQFGSPVIREVFDREMNGPANDDVLSWREYILSLSKSGNDRRDATGPEWFKRTTIRIDHLKRVEDDLATKVSEQLGAMIDREKAAFWRGLAAQVLLIVSISLLALIIARSLSQPMKKAAQIMRRLSTGDLTVEPMHAYPLRSEIGMIAAAIRSFLSSLREKHALEMDTLRISEAHSVERRGVLMTMASSVEASTETGLQPIVDGSNALPTRSEQMCSALNTVRLAATHASAEGNETKALSDEALSAIEALIAAIAEIAEQVDISSLSMQEVVENARMSRQMMDELASVAEDITPLVSLIETIASQTNLLALNATIEAARAGEAGRGFAIVAQEVKSLATQTATSTNAIAGRVAAIQSKTAEVRQAIATADAATESAQRDKPGDRGSVERTARCGQRLVEFGIEHTDGSDGHGGTHDIDCRRH